MIERRKMSKEVVCNFPEQARLKPKIEEVIYQFYDGEMLKIALDFVTNLRANKITPAWSSPQKWKANYKGKLICMITLPDRGFNIPMCATLLLGNVDTYKEQIKEKELQNLLFDDITYCAYSENSNVLCSLNKPCVGGEIRTVLGQNLSGVCHFSTKEHVRVSINSTSKINDVLTLLELEQQARKETINASKSLNSNDVQEIAEPKKPVIEDIASEILTDEALDVFLNFIKWIYENKLSITWNRTTWYTHSKSWKVNFKGNEICGLNLVFDGPCVGSWYVDRLGFDDTVDEHLKEFIWSNVNSCKNCDVRCLPSYKRPIILGKEFTRVCRIGFWNVSVEKIEFLQQLILARSKM